MTKKFIHTAKKVNGQKCKSEFIIPDIFNGKPNLIGIETGKKYNAGIIVYTGVDLTVDKIFEKAEMLSKIGFFRRRKAKNTISKYLTQIKNTKIGSVVTLTNDHELVKIEKEAAIK